MSLTFSIEADPSSATANWIIDRLIAFNESQAIFHGEEPSVG
jgi:hypothetical protein